MRYAEQPALTTGLRRERIDTTVTPPPTLSVVIPCLNDAPLLRRCLTTIAAQTDPRHEIIVVDNGSTDDSAAVAREFGARVVDEPRRGITWATQSGFDAATGEIMLRTDADITMPRDFMARLRATWTRALRNPGRRVVGVTGGGEFEIPGWHGRALTAAYLGSYRLTAGWALGHQPFFGTNYSISRAWWNEVRESVDFSDTLVHEDMHLSFAVRPDETVWLQRDLVLPMDPRAVQGAGQVAHRFRRGFHTIRVNWARELPQDRLSRRGALPAALDRWVR
ncbi:glycosyltransferase family 2 protein [Corynebacterium falsenii]|uniref:glycosyltransferase family 2 protein n=1 Tax=Corynebacterium falsenii TaxID=108486 RepID=UPI001CCF230E|nr:glycosyltransferase family 2 protein [Corynebacterium falsenii]UBI07324.1 glycosyltransferase family 2 protein [Corynebacterium falsenii]